MKNNCPVAAADAAPILQMEPIIANLIILCQFVSIFSECQCAATKLFIQNIPSWMINYCTIAGITHGKVQFDVDYFMKESVWRKCVHKEHRN